MAKKKLQSIEKSITPASNQHATKRVIKIASLLIIFAGIGAMYYQIAEIYAILDDLAITVTQHKPVTKSAVGCKCDNTLKTSNNSDEINKYQAILLTKELAERIDDTRDYTDKLEALKPLLQERFVEEFKELEKNKMMAILSIDQLVDIVESTAVPYKIPPDNASSSPTLDKSKLSIASGLFKVTSAEEWKVRCNPVLVDKVIQAMREKNEWDAIQALEQFEPKNNDIQKVIDNLSLRNTLKYYLGTIANGVLNNG